LIYALGAAPEILLYLLFGNFYLENYDYRASDTPLLELIYG
jgi:hypothetical protein